MTRNAPAAPPFVAEPSQAGLDALAAVVWGRGWHRVALVGASKNAGKTTALNALSAAASQHGERVGLVSIGVDGEAYDAWLDIPKPLVRVEKGTVLVTSEQAARDAGRLLKIMGPTGFDSALGPTVVARARAPGGIQLCGIPHRAHLIRAVQALVDAGAARVLVDGAYHRQAAAHADVVEACVVAVGAVLGASPEEVAERAAVTLLALATPAHEGPTSGWIALTGALTDARLAAVPTSAVGVRVEGPSHVLLTERGRAELERRGLRLAARRPVPLVAIASNPHRPGGTDDGAGSLQRAIADVLARHGVVAPPIVDVVSGAVLHPQRP